MPVAGGRLVSSGNGGRVTVECDANGTNTEAVLRSGEMILGSFRTATTKYVANGGATRTRRLLGGAPVYQAGGAAVMLAPCMSPNHLYRRACQRRRARSALLCPRLPALPIRRIGPGTPLARA